MTAAAAAGAPQPRALIPVGTVGGVGEHVALHHAGAAEIGAVAEVRAGGLSQSTAVYLTTLRGVPAASDEFAAIGCTADDARAVIKAGRSSNLAVAVARRASL